MADENNKDPFDVLGIGNAVVDVLGRIDEAFISEHGLTKGAMALIDADRALYLSGKLDHAQIRSGGSAGNTIAGLAALGASTAFFGKVADDELGDRYREDMTGLGVHFPTAPLIDEEPTARSIIVVTPDGERTMNTYLGACTRIGPVDIEDDTVKAAKIVYFEGYLWDPPGAKEVLRRAAKLAHAEGNRVSITLSDAFCVERYRDEFRDLIVSGTVDIVFANEAELLSLYETTDFENALAKLGAECPLAAVTRSEKGAVILKGDTRVDVPALAVSEVVDATGAGDMFAAGFLFGESRGLDPAQSAQLGCLLASRVISAIGPRIDGDLIEIAREGGLPV
ncbi:MAG: adenosine kinase [Pseudomonadota bacterium]